MKTRSAIDQFLSLSDAEKEADVGRAVKARSRPMTLAEQVAWKKTQAGLKAGHAAKKRGRPVSGRGSKVISLTVEQGLLKRADARAKREGISRAALIAQGLEAVLRI